MILSGADFTEQDMLAPNAGKLIDVCVELHGDKDCVSCVLPSGHTHTLTYRELGVYSDRVAAYLREELGLKSGDVVAIQCVNALAYPVVAFGVFKAGLVATNVNPLYTPDETQHQLRDSGAKVLFVIDLFGDKVHDCIRDTSVEKVYRLSIVDLFPPVKRTFLNFALRHVKKLVPEFSVPASGTLTSVLKKGEYHLRHGADIDSYQALLELDDTAVYQYTGGTTGRSKGAELTHRNIVGNISQAKATRGTTDQVANETLMLLLPLYHVYAMAVGLISTIFAGTHVILVPVPRPLSNLKPVFKAFDISILPGVNSLFLGLLEEDWFRDHPPKHLKYCFSGAAPLQSAIAHEWTELTGAPIYEGYGLTEGTCIITSMPLNEPPRMGTVGRPIAGTELKVTDEDGNALPRGEAGELWIRGPQVMKGYLNRPEVNEETFKDGWLKTGDVAVIGEDGYLKIVDRLKDMVIVSGFNVYPADIEDVLMQMPEVAEAAVVGVSDAHTGEKVVAYIVKSDQTLTAEQVREHCKEHLTNYKVPKIVCMVEELPKSPVGKVLRRKLRDTAVEEFAT